MSSDPTAIPIEFDPREQRMKGIAFHGNTPFDVPFISQIEGNLWTGGCQNGLILPHNIEHLISLYPWERYQTEHKLKTESYHYFYDADVPDVTHLEALASWAEHCIADGPTLIHCQAGLNRSGLLAALILMRAGSLPGNAIALLRHQRSPAVLCNPHFEGWLVRNPR